MNILMVCLGNICRSPLAEGIMQDKANRLDLGWTVDSAGTGNWHIGGLPDARSIVTATKNGIDISHQRARQIQIADFDYFDHILVMDASNYQNVIALAATDAHREKVAMILNYANPGRNQQVPDPYFGGDEGFDQVFRMLDGACNAFIAAHK